MDYSDWLSTVALVVSGSTAVWTWYRVYRWDKPVVTVEGKNWVIGTAESGHSRRASFEIAVYNAGNQATQILAAYWEIDRGNGIEIHFSAGPDGGSVSSLYNNAPSPRFPFPLGRYEHRAWDFEMDMTGHHDVEGILRARPVAKYTSRKKSELAFGAWMPFEVTVFARQDREAGDGGYRPAPDAH